MQYDFDKCWDRRGTSCVKYDMMDSFFGSDGLLPMWVADMDIATPDFILDDLRKRLEHPFLGYTFGGTSYREAVLQWLEKHYSVNAKEDEIHYIPGIVAGIAFCLQAFTREGDAVVVTTPVYPPFLNLPQHGHRELRCSPLQIRNGRFSIDYDDFEQRLQGARLLILSNPHNPGGTVWSPEELQRIAALCEKHHVTVISDEIHADLTLPGHRHTSYSTVSEAARSHSITFIAPSKTFNIAGLSSSVAYIADHGLREKLFGYIDGYELANGNVFAYTGAESAFRHGEPWLAQLLEYLENNICYAIKHLQKHIPEVKIMWPEASFLLWMDFSALGLTHDGLRRRFIEKAHVALNDGTAFGGKKYECHFRMNIGCPRPMLEEGIQRMCDALWI